MYFENEQDKEYNNWWKNFDMEKTGYLFENCSDYIHDKFGVYLNIPVFLNFYLNYDLRNNIDNHHPKLSTISMGEILDLLIKVDLNNEIPDYMKSNYNNMNNYKRNELYWIGWFFIYCLYTNDDVKDSRDLNKILNFETLNKLYTTFHEMDLRNCYERVFG